MQKLIYDNVDGHALLFKCRAFYSGDAEAASIWLIIDLIIRFSKLEKYDMHGWGWQLGLILWDIFIIILLPALL